MTNQLTTTELADRKRLEGIIRSGLHTFIEVGKAIAEFHGKKLYRSTHSTFDKYMDEVWKMDRTRAYQLMDAAQMSTIVDIPNESQARELAPLKDKPDLLRTVVAEVAAKSKRTGQPITATVMREAVRPPRPQRGRN